MRSLFGVMVPVLQLLANLHLLRCLEVGSDLPKAKELNSFFNSWAAVSFSTGPHAQQYNPSSDPSLTNTVQLFINSLPVNHQRPERPTYLKAVSIPDRVGLASSRRQSWFCYCCNLCLVFAELP